MQVFRRIAADIQVGTLQRAVGAESGDDDETARTHGAPDLFDIAFAIFFPGQEVKHRAVVPNVVARLRQVHRGHIPDPPIDPGCTLTQPGVADRQRRFGDIQHGDMLVVRIQQVVDQHGCACTHVDDARFGGIQPGAADDFQRDFGARLEPADAVDLLAAVDVFPMLAVAHLASLRSAMKLDYLATTSPPAAFQPSKPPSI